MKQISTKFIVLAFVLIAINLSGLIWIHHDLTALRPATVLATKVHLSPNRINADSLKIVFDREIVTSEDIGLIKESAAFDLEPHWPGAWKWSAQDTLEYLFDEPLPPGRIFNLNMTDQFKIETGMTLDGETSFELRTVELTLFNCRRTAADQQAITVELRFNQPVDPADLLRHISFFDASAETDEHPFDNVQCLTQDIRETHVIRVRRPASGKLRILIDRDLAGPNADLTMTSTAVKIMDVGRGFCYLSNYTSMPRFDETASIRLRFSKSLSREQQLPQVRTNPEVQDLKVHRDRLVVVRR